MGAADNRPIVLIDCTAIPAQRSGVGRYVEGLVRGLTSDQTQLTLVTQFRDREALLADAPFARVVSLPRFLALRPLRLAWEQIGLPILARHLGVGAIHSPHYTYPLLWRGPRIVTVHDATFITDPHLHTPLKARFFRWWLSRAWASADVVITPSAATAREVTARLGEPGGVIEVAHLGVDAINFSPPTETMIADFRSLFGLEPRARWFAFLGTIEPRKNLPTLLDAYALVRESLGNRAPRLLISGGRGWDTVAGARLDVLGADSGVTDLGYVHERELTALLGGATAVLYPSLGEGFGLPVLEAMACGAAVITTNRLAIPEVGGDAVLYSEPERDALAAAMLAVATDENLRAELSMRALRQAARFSWRATASAHAGAYLTAVLSHENHLSAAAEHSR